MLLESGVMSSRNVLNNIFKNIADLCIVATGFIFFGFDIIDGTSPLTPFLESLGGLITPRAPQPGDANAVSASSEIGIFFQAVFAATAVTICSGSVSGRILPLPYLIFSFVFGSLVYPSIAFHVWNPAGALYGVFVDFAGSMVVHGVGGFAGLAGAIILGPRLGRCGYYGGIGREHAEMLAARHKQNNVPLAALGVFLLWIGWYGFNGGTVFAGAIATDGLAATFESFGKVIINTTIAPATAVIAVLLISFSGALGERIYLTNILNGILTGLVGITAACDVLSVGQSAVVGVISGVLYVIAQEALLRLRIDDPVGAFPVHGIGGIVGVLAVALAGDGLIAGDVLAQQLQYGLLIAAVSFACAYVCFFVSGVLGLMLAPSILGGQMRVEEAEDSAENPGGVIRRNIRYGANFERTGLDLAVHGQRAYNIGSE